MESAGVYWKPVYAVLEAEGALEIVAIFKMSPFHDEVGFATFLLETNPPTRRVAARRRILPVLLCVSVQGM